MYPLTFPFFSFDSIICPSFTLRRRWERDDVSLLHLKYFESSVRRNLTKMCHPCRVDQDHRDSSILTRHPDPS